MSFQLHVLSLVKQLPVHVSSDFRWVSRQAGHFGQQKNILLFPEIEPRFLSGPNCSLVLYWTSYSGSSSVEKLFSFSTRYENGENFVSQVHSKICPKNRQWRDRL